jgi:hypothetical protein
MMAKNQQPIAIPILEWLLERTVGSSGPSGSQGTALQRNSCISSGEFIINVLLVCWDRLCRSPNGF